MGLFDFFKKKEPKVSITFSSHEYTPQELQQQQEDKVSKIKNLARNSTPSENGLHPHEIAILSHATHYKTLGNDFPRYWYFDYGIDDPQQVLNMLLDRGFIRAATAKESAEKLKVSELKDILSEFGVAAKGKKADLVEAVQENIEEDDLARKIPVRRYALTELGEQELKENKYVTYFGSSSKYGLTVWDMNKMIQNYPHNLFRDRIWAHLNQQVYESTKTLKKDGDMYSFYLREISVRYEMCDFLIEEDKHLLDALGAWTRALYYDLMVASPARFKMILDLEKCKGESAMRRIGDKKTGENILIEDNSPPQFKEQLSLSLKVKSVQILQERLALSSEQFFQTLIGFLAECQAVNYELMRSRNITRLNLPCEDIVVLVVAEANGNKEAADTVYRNIERQIKQDKTPVWRK